MPAPLFITVMRKDLKVIFRDRTALLFVFGLPLVFAVMFGLIYSGKGSKGGQPAPIKALVVNRDSGKYGAELIEAMKQVGLTVEPAQDVSGMIHRVKTGERPVGVEIPQDFSERLEAAVSGVGSESPPQATLHVSIDPAEVQLAGLVQGALFGATQRVAGPLYSAAFGRVSAPKPAVALDISTQAEAKSAHEPSTGDRVMPGLMVYFVFFMANGVAVTLITERQEGTLRRMLSSPISPGQILLGKMLARSIVGALQLAMLVIIGKQMMDLSLGIQPLGLLLIALACLFAASGLGLLIATFGKTQEQIQGMTTLVLLMMGLLSGCLFPREFLPETMQRLSYITPHAWALTAAQDLLVRNLPLISALPGILMVLLFGMGFFGLALVRFRYE